MKRLMKAALALLLAMALTLVACDPKVDEPRHGEQLWHEEPITVDNAAAGIRAFFDEIEKRPYGIYLNPDLAILNLVGRPLAQLGDSNKAALQTKLTDSGITAEWANGKLALTESIAEGGETPDHAWRHKGEYEMIQDANGDWSISVSNPDDAEWGFEGTLAKDKERGCFVSIATDRDDPRNLTQNTFYSSVCTYNEVVYTSESVDHSKVTRTVDGVDVEVDRKGISIETIYFADKNIGDGDKIVEYESKDFEDGAKVEAHSYTEVFGHEKNGIPFVKMMTKQTYPEECVDYIGKQWVPATEGELQIPSALTELGIPGFTVKVGTFFETKQYDRNSTFDVDVYYHDTNEDGKPNEPEEVRLYLYIKEGFDDAKTMVLEAKDNDGQPIFKEDETDDSCYVPIASSPIKEIDIYYSASSLDNVVVCITLKDDPSTEANVEAVSCFYRIR